jgi:hypothetical protein
VAKKVGDSEIYVGKTPYRGEFIDSVLVKPTNADHKQIEPPKPKWDEPL